MDEDLYFKFLKILEKRGLLEWVDVSNEIQGYYSKKQYDAWETMGTLFSSLEDFLVNFIEHDHIRFVNSTNTNIRVGDKDFIRAIKVKMQLTPKGMLFFYEKKKIDQSDKGNYLTRWFIAVTGIVGIYTCVISTCNYNVTVGANSEKLEIQLLNSHITQQDIAIKKLKQDTAQKGALYHNKVSTPAKVY